MYDKEVENSKQKKTTVTRHLQSGLEEGWIIKWNFKGRKCLNYLHYFTQGDLSLSYDYNRNIIHMIVQYFLLQISKKIYIYIYMTPNFYTPLL